jgi:hypothetical protein
VLALLFAYSHYYALFSVAAQATLILGVLLGRSRGNPLAMLRNELFWNALLAADVMVVGWLPWLPFFLKMRAQVQADFWTRPLTWWDVPFACYKMFVEPENARPDQSAALLAALLCSGGLLGLLWKARAGEWYILLASAVPVGLSVLVSTWDTKVFTLRYFLFAHLFMLAGLAALVWRIRGPWARGLGCALALASSLSAYVYFWQELDVAHKPGARGAVAYIASRRQAEEPVIVCSPLLYLPLLYHAAEGAGYKLYSSGQGFVHYEGAAALSGDDLIDTEDLTTLSTRRAWVVNMTGWGGRTVPVPGSWVPKSEVRLPEVWQVQGEIIVIEYEEPTPVGGTTGAPERSK